jgi:hypothetical protein
MTAANKSWVCATCGQGVTRRSSGLRHINKLHSGKAILVRPYVYVAGIVSGRFQQSDPSLYRKRTKEEFSSKPHSDTYSPSQFGRPLTEIVHEETNRYATEAQTRPFPNIVDKNPSNSLPSVESGDQIDRPSPADSILGMIRRKQMLQEIGKLARKHYASHIANGIIMTARSMAQLEDDKSLHITLERLKKIGKSQSF